ncbi:rhodanese-like domain-containing protein [Marivita sp. S6314]|uniref:rhodanese-like domain-containing protein n=1 Tax=Marivita sp. S6314 TaxID=2926406 RepID=UPI001FF5DF72|nr:rhodanese-like domain-containing protein [Marivita sp. S6314]MCK0150347.1 rhodanese-like domain-containing protein [Marivita sp. S6314]
MGLTRRTLLTGLAVTSGVAGTAYLLLDQVPPDGASEMTPPELLEAVRENTVLLVDIRRPDEWAKTGLAEGATPIDMRRPDFLEALRAQLGADQRPVALICARGVRSQRMTRLLSDAGITPIIDVPEGMLGSAAGPGWLKRSLPVVPWTG